MIAHAFRTLRHRRLDLVATFVVVLLGAVLVMAFASLLDTVVANELSDDQREALVTMAVVVGGWGLIIVTFGVVSTLSSSVARRQHELALLRSAGATPRQLTSLTLVESAIVGGLAVVVAVPLGAVVGRAVLALVQATDQVGPEAEPGFGWFAIGIGGGVALLAAVLGAAIAGVRAARSAAAGAAIEGVEPGPLGRVRWIVAVLLVAGGVACAVVTATALRGAGIDAMQTAGQAGIWGALGLAVMSPALVRLATAVLRRPVGWFGSLTVELAVESCRRRPRTSARVVMPVIVFVAIASGTIAMQRIEDLARASEGGATPADERTVQTLNYVVVAMISLFAAIVLLNALFAAAARRRREMGQLRLLGATPGETLGSLAAEVVLLVVVGTVAGWAASLATVVPYAVSRLDRLPPVDALVVYPVVATIALALSLGAALVAGGRAVREPATVAAEVLAGT